MVEVFKTNVQHTYTAATIVQHIEEMYAGAKASFDLEDCDRILRVESTAGFDVQQLITLLEKFCTIVVLPDEITGKGFSMMSIQKYSLSA